MNHPGDGLRQLTTRFCSERNRRRLLDPAIADLQAEFAAARRGTSRWGVPRALASGYVSVAKVLVIAICGDLRHEARSWQPAERALARGGIRVAVIMTAAATALTIIYTLSKFTFHAEFPGRNPVAWALIMRAGLGIYLLPSTLALTLPFGLVLGTAWTLRGTARTGKLGVGAMVLAVACSLGMFVNIAWLTPEANQAFRQIAVARFFHWDEDRPLTRGENELTLAVLRERIAVARQFGLPQNARFFETLYHKKLAITAAAVPMIGVLLALAFRRKWNGAPLIAAAIAVFALYYTGLWTSVYANAIFSAPPIVAAWLPNGLVAAAAILLAAAPRAPTSPRAAA